MVTAVSAIVDWIGGVGKGGEGGGEGRVDPAVGGQPAVKHAVPHRRGKKGASQSGDSWQDRR